MRDDSVEIISQSFLLEVIASSSGMDRDVHSMASSVQHLLCRPMLLERLSWRVTCPRHASFCLLTVASRGSYGPTRKFIGVVTFCSSDVPRRLGNVIFALGCLRLAELYK